MVYRRSFEIPSAWNGKRILLHFGAVDYESEVFINGKSAGAHKGGYDPFSFDITPFLAGNGPQEIVVRVFDPTDIGGQPRGKQSTNPEGIMYTPTTGIWQTVWLEPVDAVSARDVKIVPDVDGKQLHLTVNSTAPDKAATVHVEVKDGDTVVQRFDGKADTELTIPIPSPKLWSPERPFLYGLDISLGTSGTVTDHVTSYFGMRKISIGKVGDYLRMLLNNQPVFQLGPLDQGFWPDGTYTAPTDEALKNDIVMMKAMGFNMVRKHEKVEPARWYYWADKLGLLVWQDMPSPDSYLDRAEAIPPVDHEAFESQLRRLVETHWNSPSIIMWVIFNEGQGQFDTQRLTGIVKALDPSRLVDEASGSTITGAGDVNDLHHYPEPDVRRTPTPNQALANGEFGGIGYHISGHSWDPTGFGYTTVSNPDDLLYLYAEYLNNVKDLRDNKGLSAAVYTELTDVQIEINGLMTYDSHSENRCVENCPSKPLPAQDAELVAVVPTSEQSGQEWRFTTTKPDDNWSSPEFSDATWSKGNGGFGNANAAGTSWTSSNIWIRKHFNPGALTEDQINNFVVRDLHQGQVEVFINGVPAYAQRGRSATWEYRSISSEARASIKANAENVLVGPLRQKGGDGQFIDAGLDVRVPAAQ